MQEVKLTLTAEEAVAIVNTLGQLPTQSNAYPLFMKVKTLTEAQLQPSAEQPSAPAETAA